MRNGKAAVYIVLAASLVCAGLASPLILEALEFIAQVLWYMFLGPIQ